MKINYFRLVFFFLAILLPTTSYAAPVPVTVDVRPKENNLRVLLVYDKSIEFKVEHKDSEVIIRFEEEIKTRLTNIDYNNSHYNSIKVGVDKRSIILTLNDKNYIHTRFEGTNFSGLDFSNKPVLAKKTKDLSSITPELKSRKIVPTSIIPVMKPEQKVKEEKKQLAEKKPSPPVEEQKPKKNKSPDDIRVVIDTKGLAKWTYPWKEKVAAAVFMQGTKLYVVFNKPSYTDYTSISDEYLGTIKDGQRIHNKFFTILKYDLPGVSNVRAYKEINDWVVEVPPINSDKKFRPAREIKQYSTPFSKGIFFPAERMAKPNLEIIDTDTGNIISIVTLYDSDYGVVSTRKFVDFRLLKTAQGFAANIISDRARTEIIKPGIEVLVPRKHFVKAKKSGFAKTKDKKEYYELETLDTGTTESLITFKEGDIFNYNTLKNKIQHKIVNAGKKKRIEAYLEYTNFFLSHKMYQETIGALRIIEQDPYASLATNKIALLRGMSEFALGHYIDSSKAFDKIDDEAVDINLSEEVRFWKNITKIAVIGVGEKIDFLKFRSRFLSKYPKEIRHKIALMDIEHGLATYKEKEISDLRIVARIIEDETDNKHMRNTMKYYKGVLALRRKDPDRALRLWRDIIADEDDRLNSTRAKFAELSYLSDRKIMQHKKVVEELEKLRMRWRGDKVESAILKKLGELYSEEKNYVKALRVWKSLVSNHADQSQTLLITSEMGNAFVKIFADDKSITLSNLEIVALYFEFRELTPIGSMGDKIIRRLSQKLVNLDLLGRATTLLLHQLKYRAKGRDKIKLGTQIAKIYLMNKKPKMTIKMLYDTDVSDLTFEETIERSHIKAVALLSLDKLDDAMYELRNDFSDAANELKAYIYQEKKDWLNLKRVLNVKLAERFYDAKPLSEEESMDLMRLTIAHFMLGDHASISSLERKFNDNMAENDKAKRFIEVVLDNKSFDVEDLQTSVSAKSLETFLGGYRESFLSPKNL